jgi:nucleoside-diphosphate-sugar epimerase
MASLPFMFLNSALRAESVEIWSKNIGDQIHVASRDFLYVKDLCGIIETIILLKEWEHKVLDVGTGKSLSLTNLVSEIHRVIPLEGRVVELPRNVDQRFYQLNTKANVDLLFSMIPRMRFTPIKEAITEMLNELS